jgi:predicted transcriptional regulator
LKQGSGRPEEKQLSEKSYVATEKGRRFLEDYHELQKYSEIAESKKRTLERFLSTA